MSGSSRTNDVGRKVPSPKARKLPPTTTRKGKSAASTKSRNAVKAKVRRIEKKSRAKKTASRSHAVMKSEAMVKSEASTRNEVVRPTPEECYYATASLAVLHPHVVERNDDRRATLLESCGLRDSITDSVISTMLSQNTTDKNSKQAYATLKKTFPSWSDVVACDDLDRIEDAIKVAGLAKTRAERIRSLLRTIKDERGEPSLDYLRTMSDDEVKEELSRFKGLGPKTISCVLLFAMGRSEFPVDTHVLRIAKNRLGWVPASATRESAYEHLNETVPAEVKLDLHCLLVTHGKHCHACAAGGKPQFPPADGSRLDCPLSKSVMASKMNRAAAAIKKEEESAVPDSDGVKSSSAAAASTFRKVKVEENHGITNKRTSVKEES